MPNRTILLSKILGVFCTLEAVIFLAARHAMIQWIDAMLASRPALVVCGAIVLACGLAIVYFHMEWQGGLAPVLITLIGLAATCKGMLLIAFPPQQEQALALRMGYPNFLSLYMLVDLAIGLYLGYVGFFAETSAVRSHRMAA